MGSPERKLSDWSLVIMCPMANERDSAETMVRDFLKAAEGFRKVIFMPIFDRSCTDGTIDLLRDMAKTEPRLNVVYLENSRGQVEAYLNGYAKALALPDVDWVLEVDAGFSHRAEDLKNFFPPMLDGAEAVFATRFAEGGEMRTCKLSRRVISQGGTLLTNLLLGTKLTDMTSGYQMFSRPVLEYLVKRGIHSRGHFFQTEMKAYSHRFRIAEAPIIYMGASSVVGGKILRDAFTNLWRLVVLRFSHQLFV